MMSAKPLHSVHIRSLIIFTSYVVRRVGNGKVEFLDLVNFLTSLSLVSLTAYSFQDMYHFTFVYKDNFSTSDVQYYCR